MLKSFPRSKFLCSGAARLEQTWGRSRASWGRWIKSGWFKRKESWSAYSATDFIVVHETFEFPSPQIVIFLSANVRPRGLIQQSTIYTIAVSASNLQHKYVLWERSGVERGDRKPMFLGTFHNGFLFLETGRNSVIWEELEIHDRLSMLNKIGLVVCDLLQRIHSGRRL
jgi:hypothetical protein